MGVGNVFVDSPEECIFFVNYDSLVDYSESIPWFLHSQVLDFVEAFKEKFPSFSVPVDKKWTYVDQEWLMPLLENELFYVAVQDNVWSLAISLRAKVSDTYLDTTGLRKRHAVNYRLGLLEKLLQIFGEVDLYVSPLTGGKLTKQSWDEMSLEQRRNIPYGYVEV